MKKRCLIFAGLMFIMTFAFSCIAMAQTGRDKANIVEDLYNIGYLEVHLQESTDDAEMMRSQNGFTSISNENKIVLENEVEKLYSLSDNAYDKEISKMVKEIILENKDKENVYWTRDFINKYAAKYCPEYVDELENKMIGENNAITVNNDTDLMAAKSAGSKTVPYSLEWKGAGLVKYWEFTVRVDWTWDNNDVITYCAPKTSGKTFMPLTYYNGIVDEYIKKLENGTRYEVYKQGHFSFAVDGNGAFNKYPRIKINVYGGGPYTVGGDVE